MTEAKTAEAQVATIVMSAKAEDRMGKALEASRIAELAWATHQKRVFELRKELQSLDMDAHALIEARGKARREVELAAVWLVAS